MTDGLRDTPSAEEIHGAGPEATDEEQAWEATDADDPAWEATGGDGEEEAASAPRPRRKRRLLPRALRNATVVTVIMAVLLVISGGVATWLYFKQYRPDQQTDAGVADTVVTAASDGTIAVLSYSSDSLESDFANARSHLAGDFLIYYNDFTQQIVTPAARQKSLKTTAHVTGAALSELHPDSAVVLVFVDQDTTIKDSPQPSMKLSSVLVHLIRVNDNWFINKFSPL